MASRPGRSNRGPSGGHSSSNRYPGPPVPVPVGSPPWIMKPSIMRWKIVPAYKGSDEREPSRGSVHSFAPVASSMKFATVFGAWSGISRTVNEPMDVTNVASVMVRGFPWDGGGSLPAGPGAGAPQPREGGRDEMDVVVPVRGPERARRHREPRERDQRPVVIHAPPREVPPALLAVGFQWDARGPQAPEDLVEFLARDRDRVAAPRVVVDGDIEELGEVAQAQVARPDHELGLGLPRGVDARGEQRRAVQDRTGGGDPRLIGMGGPEEHERGERAVALVHVGEPVFPLGPQRPEALELADPPRQVE